MVAAMRSSPDANPRPLGVGALVAALVLGGIRRQRNPVPAELLGYANDLGRTEADYAEQFNGRLVNLVGAAGVVLALVINLGTDVFARLQPDDPNKDPLDLGPVGEPLFVALYVVALGLLLASAWVAVRGVYVGRARAARVSVGGLRAFGRNAMPLRRIRRILYPIAVDYVEDQRELNKGRMQRVRRAGRCFVAAIFVVVGDAAVLGVRALGL